LIKCRLWEQATAESGDAAKKLATALGERDAAQQALQMLQEKLTGAESARAALEADLKKARSEHEHTVQEIKQQLESSRQEAQKHQKASEDLNRQLAALAAASQVCIWRDDACISVAIHHPSLLQSAMTEPHHT
jgi:glycosyltransferase A (GT-A) superfamily protein (DUF2064 family)